MADHQPLPRRLAAKLGALLGGVPAEPPPLLAAPEPGPLLDQVRASSGMLRRILEENILPFWYPRVLDPDHGGYLVHHDALGRWKGPAPRHLVVQARVLWFFARLARAGHGERYLEAAASGFTFLRDRLWDQAESGFYWAVDHEGRAPVIADKRVYGQAFALFAVAEYAAASGAPGARTFGRAVWEYLEQSFHDPVAGGYFSRARDLAGAGPAAGGLKSQNDHLHLLEALTALWTIDPDPLVRERTVEVILALASAAVRKRAGASSEAHRGDWAPHQADGVGRVSYGHDVEGGWLLLESCDTLGIPAALLTDHAVTMFTSMRRFGFDHRRGGIFAAGPAGRRADDRRKLWWVQAEALVACLDLYVRCGLPAAGEAYLRTLHWIATVQADWEVGEWHEVVSPSGRPAGDKAGPWKGPYHSGRAMLACLERVRRLEPVSGR